MKLYYKIWVDGIVKLRSRPQNAGLWKFFAMTFMSMAMALNLVFILFVLSDLGVTDGVFKVPVNLFPGTRIDAFFSFFISYLLPFLLVNYFLIFYKEKYKELIKRYPYYGGKLYLKYFLGSLGAFLVYIIIAILVTK
ncbi:hypothetical protein GCM10027516_11700 [Niabella aquatica]